MHFHFPFTATAVLWTLTFAAHLVLLVVLMGRDRVARFPWFTTGIVLVTLRLLTVKLLLGRLPEMTMETIFIVMADLSAFVSLLVVLELARRAFGKVRRSSWIIGALVLMAIGVAVLKYWGPWPAWKTITASSTLATLRLMQLIAQKASLLADTETILVGVLIVALGRRFGAGWHSHTQKIAIGLSTASLAQLSIQAIWEWIVRSAMNNPAIVQSMPDRNRILGIGQKLSNTNGAIFVAVLIWWIVCLWRDELGSAVAAQSAAPTAEYIAPETTEPVDVSQPEDPE